MEVLVPLFYFILFSHKPHLRRRAPLASDRFPLPPFGILVTQSIPSSPTLSVTTVPTFFCRLLLLMIAPLPPMPPLLLPLPLPLLHPLIIFSRKIVSCSSMLSIFTRISLRLPRSSLLCPLSSITTFLVLLSIWVDTNLLLSSAFVWTPAVHSTLVSEHSIFGSSPSVLISLLSLFRLTTPTPLNLSSLVLLFVILLI